MPGPGEQIIGGVSPVGLFLTGVSLLGRSTLPAGTRLDVGGRAARRGVVAGPGETILTPTAGGYVPFVAGGTLTGGPVIPGTAGSLPAEALPIPPVPAVPLPIPGVPTIGPGLGQLPIPGIPPALIGPLMGQIGGSTPRGPGAVSSRASRALPVTVDEALLKVRNARMRRLVRGVATRWFAIGIAIEVIVELIRQFITTVDDGELTEAQQLEAYERWVEANPLEDVSAGGRRRFPRGSEELGEFRITEGPWNPGRPTFEHEGTPTGIGTNTGEPAREPIVVTVRRSAVDDLKAKLKKYALGAGIGLGALALLRRGGGSGKSTAAIPQAAISPLLTVGPQPFPYPLTGFGSGGVTSSSTRRCECPPKKKKGPARKCLERAQVSWRSGRYKGKLAGSKCVRFSKGK